MMSASASAPRRALIVEDEILIGMLLEDILDMQGWSVVANCASLGEAGAVDPAGIDVAILDVNVGGEPSYALADRLAAHGVGIAFATGSQPDSLPGRFAARPVIEKPYTYASVEAALGALPAAGPVAAAG